ncbi:nucleotidyltransferase domain-containing protein [Candidatus Pacearchaeota archaeon]|nr:nucleotidyltransferase domain-containing protein [Candidatus Pacearchaeota archaeon]
MKNLEKQIVNTCLERYNGNLAAVLIFGSYNTGPFVEGISDLDTIMLFKDENNMDLRKEQDELRDKLSDVNLSIHHFRTIKDYEEHIYEECSWSSWITVICGSRIAYSTKEFEDFRQRLIDNPIPKDKLINYLKHKDKVDLEGLNNTDGWNLTKALFAHIRRKLQILNYYVRIGNNSEHPKNLKNKRKSFSDSEDKLDFDYDKCLSNLRGIEYQKELRILGYLYKKRKSLGKNSIDGYIKIAKYLAKRALKIL